MSDALVTHPCVGSVWLIDARVEGDYVVGFVDDKSGVGSPYMPEDYRGESVLMNFPIKCVRKWTEPYRREPVR